MSLDPRNRMISFRLSAEEYERFRELCFTNGTRSVSEMARTAINSLLQQPSHSVAQGSIDARMAEFEARLDILSKELRGMNQFFQQYRQKLNADSL